MESRSRAGDQMLPAPDEREFIFFPKLPTELRCMIWKLNLRPRIVTFDWDDDKSYYAVKCRPPSNLTVCSESRTEALKVYKLAFALGKAKVPIYFNPSLDTILVENVALFCSLMSKVDYAQDVASIKYCIERYNAWGMSGNHYFDKRDFENFVQLSSLKEIAVVGRNRRNKPGKMDNVQLDTFIELGPNEDVETAGIGHVTVKAGAKLAEMAKEWEMSIFKERSLPQLKFVSWGLGNWREDSDYDICDTEHFDPEWDYDSSNSMFMYTYEGARRANRHFDGEETEEPDESEESDAEEVQEPPQPTEDMEGYEEFEGEEDDDQETSSTRGWQGYEEDDGDADDERE